VIVERGLRETLVYSIADPWSPQLVDEAFWDEDQPWNSYCCADNRDPVFSTDGQWLFMARFSVLQRFKVLDCGIGEPVIFWDGFETGDTSRWSAAVP
jgi:hypothetical protein